MTRDELIEAMARAMCKGAHTTALTREPVDERLIDARWHRFQPAAIEALSAIEAAGVALVPVEPTPEMLIAAHHEQDRCAIHNYGGHPTADDTYAVMLAVSPLAKTQP